VRRWLEKERLGRDGAKYGFFKYDEMNGCTIRSSIFTILMPSPCARLRWSLDSDAFVVKTDVVGIERRSIGHFTPLRR